MTTSFLRPMEAEGMRRVMPREVFVNWFGRFFRASDRVNRRLCSRPALSATAPTAKSVTSTDSISPRVVLAINRVLVSARGPRWH